MGASEPALWLPPAGGAAAGGGGGGGGGAAGGGGGGAGRGGRGLGAPATDMLTTAKDTRATPAAPAHPTRRRQRKAPWAPRSALQIRPSAPPRIGVSTKRDEASGRTMGTP